MSNIVILWVCLCVLILATIFAIINAIYNKKLINYIAVGLGFVFIWWMWIVLTIVTHLA